MQIAELSAAGQWTEAGAPYPAAASTPRWTPVEVGGKSYRVLAYRARLAGVRFAKCLIARTRKRVPATRPGEGL
jgi:hypothetical protein